MSECIVRCGQPAEPGDVYCAEDRQAANRADDGVTVGGIAHEDGLT